ncbi:MAG: hypothetical protein ACPG5U_01715 [Planktomarina sp.]
MRFVLTPDFERAFKKLNPKQKKDTQKAIGLLDDNPQAKSLRFRRLQGSADCWIANINKGDRIILAQIGPDEYELADVGAHDATYRKWNRKRGQ